MPGTKHAVLSPSSSHIWLACPPSARFASGFPDEDSQFARQGTEAHSLCQHKLETALGRETADPVPGMEFHDQEMEEASSDYALFVTEALAEMRGRCPDPQVLIEQKLDFSRWVPEGFGYGDCIIAGDGEARVIDFKYGLGVLVEADRNTQMMCYALGALELLDPLYDMKRISMTIFQPRRENVSTFSMSREELLDWADNVLAPAAALAFEGKGDYRAGDHCRFCRARSVCRARAEHNLEMARYDFRMPDSLEDPEIEAILARVDEFIAWAGDIKDHALSEALKGKAYSGFKVVEGRSVRRYTDEGKAADAVSDAGFDPYERKILGITAMSSLLGKKRFEEILGPLVYKAPGKPALVPESDRRPAMETAREDFKVMEE